MSFWFVDLIPIKQIFDVQWIASGFYWKYVSEINTTQPAVKFNMEELKRDVFDFSVELKSFIRERFREISKNRFSLLYLRGKTKYSETSINGHFHTSVTSW